MALCFHNGFAQHGKEQFPHTSAATKAAELWFPARIMPQDGNLAYIPGANHLPVSNAYILDPSQTFIRNMTSGENSCKIY